MAKKGIDKDLLAQIISATEAGSHFFVSREEGKPLLDHKPPLIVVNFEITQGDKAAARSTEAAKAIVGTVAAPVTTTSPFAIVKGAQLPPSKRGAGLHSGAPKQYPFDQMEIGDSFFVPVSEKHPNPVKTLGSTVSSANMRFAEVVEGQTREVERAKRGPDRKAMTNPDGSKVMEKVTLPVYKFTRKFEIRAVEAGKTYGNWTAEANGALIMRVPLS